MVGQRRYLEDWLCGSLQLYMIGSPLNSSFLRRYAGKWLPRKGIPELHLTCYSCVFGKRNYRVLVRISVCVCLCVCVFLHDNSKRNRSRNTKLDYIVVYENSSVEFDIELRRIKVKVTVGVQKFSPFTTIQTVRSYSSTLVQARNLILSIYLHLILIYKIYECRHA